MPRGLPMRDLFSGTTGTEPIGDGACVLRGFATTRAPALLAAVQELTAAAPFRRMVTPGGYTM